MKIKIKSNFVIILIFSILTAIFISNRNSTRYSPIIPTIQLSPTIQPSHSGQIVKVIEVIDGDTIKIETGETVRYIGINTPELKDPRKDIECFSKEASDKNRQLVEGKVVELEKDISEADKYGRLLRYVWIGDRLINEELVREGFAQSSTFPPDIKYQARFIEAARLAQSENKGFWGIGCMEF